MVRAKNTLGRKLARDMWKSRTQFLAVILLCALGTWCFSGLDALWRTIDTSANTYFDQCNVADLWINLAPIDRAALETLGAVPGVKETQARASYEIKADLPHEPSLQMEAYDGEMRVNLPYLLSGEALSPSDLRGCLLDDGFARANGLDVGDRLTLKTAAGDYSFTIRGLCLSGEYLSDKKDGAYDPLNYGFVLVSAASVAALPLNQLVATLEDGAQSDEAKRAVNLLYPEALVVDRETQQSTAGVQSDVDMFHNLCYLFPLLAFAVAAMIVLATITRMMENQRLQMGTLKALGFYDGQIRNHYMCYALYPSLIGSLAGLAVGRRTLPSILWELETANFQFPYRIDPPVSWAQWAVCGLSVLLAVYVCYRTYRQSGRETTAQLLRPKPPRAGRKLLLERFPALWSRMGFNAKMVARNLMRNKGRTATSLAGVLCCVMLIITSLGLQESVEYSVGKYYHGTLAYTARADLDEGAGTAESYRRRIDAERTEGLMEKSLSIRVGEKSRAVVLNVLEDGQQLLLLGKNETLLELPEDGILLSEKLAEYLHAETGDRVELWLPGETEPVVTRAAGIAYVTMGQTAYASRSMWESFRKGGFTPTALLMKNPSPEAVELVDRLDELEGWEDKEQKYQETLGILDSVRSVFSLMFFIALGLAFVVLYNMGLLNFMERYREYATLKVLGYHQQEIRRLMFSENNLLTLLGVLLGVAPGFWLPDAIFRSCGNENIVFYTTVSPQAILIGCGATYAFSVFVSWLLTRKVKKVDMVAALKSVE